MHLDWRIYNVDSRWVNDYTFPLFFVGTLLLVESIALPCDGICVSDLSNPDRSILGLTLTSLFNISVVIIITITNQYWHSIFFWIKADNLWAYTSKCVVTQNVTHRLH